MTILPVLGYPYEGSFSSTWYPCFAKFKYWVPLWEIVFKYYCWHFYDLVCYHIVTSTQSFHWAKEAVLELAHISFKCTPQVRKFVNIQHCAASTHRKRPFIAWILKTFLQLTLWYESIWRNMMVFCRFFPSNKFRATQGLLWILSVLITLLRPFEWVLVGTLITTLNHFIIWVLA